MSIVQPLFQTSVLNRPIKKYSNPGLFCRPSPRNQSLLTLSCSFSSSSDVRLDGTEGRGLVSEVGGSVAFSAKKEKTNKKKVGLQPNRNELTNASFPSFTFGWCHLWVIR